MQMGCHGGIQHSIDLNKSHFFFKKLAFFVTDCIRSWHECKTRKVTKVYAKAAITVYLTSLAPFEA